MYKPALADHVHYMSCSTPVKHDGSQAYSSRCRAAIVTAVNGRAIDPTTLGDADAWDVSLCVLNPTGQFFNEHVVQDEKHGNGGTWHTLNSCKE